MPTTKSTDNSEEEREFNLYAAAIEESYHHQHQSEKVFAPKSQIDKAKWNKAARKKHYLKQKQSKSPKRIEEVMAFVARTVSRKEYQNNPKACQALVVEWDKLRKAKVWNESDVREWKAVKSEAQREQRDIHVGSLHELLVGKVASCRKATNTGSSKDGLSSWENR